MTWVSPACLVVEGKRTIQTPTTCFVQGGREFMSTAFFHLGRATFENDEDLSCLRAGVHRTREREKNLSTETMLRAKITYVPCGTCTAT